MTRFYSLYVSSVSKAGRRVEPIADGRGLEVPSVQDELLALVLCDRMMRGI